MQKRYIIVGAGWAGKALASELVEKDVGRVIGFIDDKLCGETVKFPNGKGDIEMEVLGHSKDLMDIVNKYYAQSVILAITHEKEDHLLEQIVKCHEQGISIHEMPDIYSHVAKKIPVQHVNHRWIVPKVTAPPHDLYTFFHDATNYLLSLVGLVFVFIPICPVIALAIKLESHGPVFFKQKRVGMKEKTFTLLKFRTMSKNGSDHKASWAKDEGHRITKVGRWLRKFRLDELPQFINVLKGDMALIGPRPEQPEFVEKLEKEIPFYHYRHLVRPGISGWAQVNYRYGHSVEDALEKLQYDLYWIEKRSFWLDLKIIFKSVKVMLTGYGAV